MFCCIVMLYDKYESLDQRSGLVGWLVFCFFDDGPYCLFLYSGFKDTNVLIRLDMKHVCP